MGEKVETDCSPFSGREMEPLQKRTAFPDHFSKCCTLLVSKIGVFRGLKGFQVRYKKKLERLGARSWRKSGSRRDAQQVGTEGGSTRTRSPQRAEDGTSRSGIHSLWSCWEREEGGGAGRTKARPSHFSHVNISIAALTTARLRKTEVGFFDKVSLKKTSFSFGCSTDSK
jgi:hypothetical protein